MAPIDRAHRRTPAAHLHPSPSATSTTAPSTTTTTAAQHPHAHDAMERGPRHRSGPPAVLQVDAQHHPDAARRIAQVVARRGLSIASQTNITDARRVGGRIADPSRWTQVIHVGDKTPRELADAVRNALALRTDGPRARRVVIDEVNAHTAHVVAGAARLLAERPKLRGKWGVYLVDPRGVGDNPKLERTLFPALRKARANVVLEAYPNMRARGFDMKAFFDKTRANLDELQREGLRPVVSLGVTDAYVGAGVQGDKNLARLLDAAQQHIPRYVRGGRVGAWFFGDSAHTDQRARIFVRFLAREVQNGA